MEQLYAALQWPGSVDQTWFIGCALLVVVWFVGLRMALPPVTVQKECVPSSPLFFASVVLVFVLLNAALGWVAYDVYMAAHVR